MVVSDILKQAKTIAIVGLSDKPERPSYEVAAYLQSKGYKIIPINPHVTEVLGERAYSTIHAIPIEIQVDIVEIFRKSEEVLQHIKEAIERREVKLIWLQEGIESPEGARIAAEADIPIVMNACMMKSHKLGY